MLSQFIKIGIVLGILAFLYLILSSVLPQELPFFTLVDFQSILDGLGDIINWGMSLLSPIIDFQFAGYLVGAYAFIVGIGLTLKVIFWLNDLVKNL